MSCQPHRVTSGQSTSGHRQKHISKLFSHIYTSTLCQVNLQNQSLHKHKTCIHKHQTQIFEELVPLLLPLLKEHTRLVYPVTPFPVPNKPYGFLWTQSTMITCSVQCTSEPRSCVNREVELGSRRSRMNCLVAFCVALGSFLYKK